MMLPPPCFRIGVVFFRLNTPTFSSKVSVMVITCKLQSGFFPLSCVTGFFLVRHPFRPDDVVLSLPVLYLMPLTHSPVPSSLSWGFSYFFQTIVLSTLEVHSCLFFSEQSSVCVVPIFLGFEYNCLHR